VQNSEKYAQGDLITALKYHHTFTIIGKSSFP